MLTLQPTRCRTSRIVAFVMLALVSGVVSPRVRGRAPGHDLPSAPLSPSDKEVRRAAEPAGGLSLEDAIATLERDNLSLRTLRASARKSQADVLKAGQPLTASLYIGVANLGGRTVIERSWEFPIGRWPRIAAARLRERISEAQYQNALRVQSANLASVMVDVQEAESRQRFNQVQLNGLDRLVSVTESSAAKGITSPTDTFRVKIQRDRCAVAADDAGAALRTARLSLASLLNVPFEQAEGLRVRNETETMVERARSAPPVKPLIRTALQQRPDLRASRLTLMYAYTEWLRAWADQLPNVSVISAPVNPGPQRQQGVAPHVRTGLRIQLPVLMHSPAEITRARINFDQARNELAALEHQIAVDVAQAQIEHELSLFAMNTFKERVIPEAQKVRNQSYRQYLGGETNVTDYLRSQEDYNQVIRQYQDALFRHLRSQNALNSAVGRRVVR